VEARLFLETLLSEEGMSERLTHLEPLPPRDPTPEPFPGLPDPLPARLDLLGIKGLYPHQTEGLELIESGRNVIVATGTASGKTLVYDLAFAKRAIEDRRSTALFLFPTKALARDQLRQIRELKLPQIRAAVYDGDTPRLSHRRHADADEVDVLKSRL
jgi:DEAD/DEAH box helicase domain-containing protein